MTVHMEGQVLISIMGSEMAKTLELHEFWGPKIQGTFAVCC